ncbi:MAG: hypothetical protein WA982_06530 [Rubrobacteraceae bacterium]
MSYGELIKDAFRITLRNRYLWFFGFFAGGTFGANIPSGGGGGSFNTDDFDLEQSGASSFGAQIPAGETALIVGLVLLGLLLFLAFIILSLISQGGLASSVYALDRGESRRFSSTWRGGTSSFWRVLGYYIVYFLIGLALFVVIVIPFALLIGGVFLLTESTGARVSVSILGGLAGVLLMVVVFVALSIVAQFALREIVVRGERVIGSFGGGFRLFRANLGKSLLVWLIQIGLTIAAGIALVLALLIIGLVLFLPTIILATQEFATAAIVTGVVAGVILLPIIIVASAALGTFFHAYWTLAYLRISSPEDQEVAQAAVAV